MWSDEYDPDDDGVSETVPCPACGAAVYEDADQCPACGEWIIPLAASRGRGWLRPVSIILIMALLLGVAGGLIRWFR